MLDIPEHAWSGWGEPETWMVHGYRSTRQIDVLKTDDALDGGDVLLGFRTPVQHLLPPVRVSR